VCIVKLQATSVSERAREMTEVENDRKLEGKN
jgi:hypothetical protein